MYGYNLGLGSGGNCLPRTGLIFLALERDGFEDSIGLSIISGTWPNCTVQAIAGGPLESFGPFAGGAIVNFANLPQVIESQFYWGDKGYAFYYPAQSISVSKRALDYLNAEAYVGYIYVGANQLYVGGEPVAAIFGV
jgi:hypothetical protein